MNIFLFYLFSQLFNKFLKIINLSLPNNKLISLKDITCYCFLRENHRGLNLDQYNAIFVSYFFFFISFYLKP